MSDTYYWLDTELTPYSPPKEIEAWINQLKTLEQTPEVKVELVRVGKWLKRSRKYITTSTIK